jgi:hypothetical protein
MDKLAITADVLRRLMDSEDAAATLVAERRLEELLATEPWLERKIEMLRRVRRFADRSGDATSPQKAVC